MWCLPPRATVAHEGHNHDQPVTKVADQVAWKPTAIPERILLSWTGDPAHTQAVTWRTDTSVNHGLARIAPAGHGPRFAEKAVEVAAETIPFESDLGTAHYHTVQFDHLEPKTTYAYRVGDGTNWSEWIQFTTASDQNEPFTFVYFGDAQNLLKSHWSRVIRQAYRDAPKAAFLLHAGDLINRAEVDAEWGEWFYAGSFIHRMVPCIATPGNHEYPRPPGLFGRLKSATVGTPLAAHFCFSAKWPRGTGRVGLLDRLPGYPDHFAQFERTPARPGSLAGGSAARKPEPVDHPHLSPSDLFAQGGTRQSGAAESVAADL